MRKEAVGRKDVGRGLKRPRVRRGCVRVRDRAYARERNHWLSLSGGRSRPAVPSCPLLQHGGKVVHTWLPRSLTRRLVPCPPPRPSSRRTPRPLPQ